MGRKWMRKMGVGGWRMQVASFRRGEKLLSGRKGIKKSPPGNFQGHLALAVLGACVPEKYFCRQPPCSLSQRAEWRPIRRIRESVTKLVPEAATFVGNNRPLALPSVAWQFK
jgi:hypothetical protein